MQSGIFPHPRFAAYELLDSGAGEKLERIGGRVLRRPDPQALWGRRLLDTDWRAADLQFVRESDRGGRWEGPSGRAVGTPSWELEIADLEGLEPMRLELRATPFKHVGLFPEQAANWTWVEERRRQLDLAGVGEPRLLNLFAYTGAATVLAAAAGWQVTHVDASRASLDWAAENARRSGLPGDAVRWILDDACAYSAREQRRGNTYHGVLLDPPAYGRGPKGEKWTLAAKLDSLLRACHGLLDAAAPSFMVLSTYAVGYSALAYRNILQDLGGGAVEVGELALPETEGGRLLPCGYAARLQLPGGA
ncbi:MAG TPA: class I SAM-dependent methyltransferase [Planctomycetota bacterium]